MGQLFVVGDVHGCVRELEALLDGLPVAPGDTIVFLGDYIDRGPDSKATVDLLLGLQARSAQIATIFLKGNHEDMFLAHIGEAGRYGEAFLYNGGIETLVSYGIDPRLPGAAVREALPAAHLAFFRGLGLTHVRPPYLMVHAGIDPGQDLDRQSDEDLLWIRHQFIGRRHGLPYTVCFGHTPCRELLLDLPYKIGLDTGCVYGNRLSCIELETPRLFEVRAGSRRVDVRDLADAFRRHPHP